MTPAKGSTATRLTRGVRNNNPGNIRHALGVKWQGAIKGDDASFVTFASPEMGVRALVRTLLTYQNRHNLHTIAGIIDRWAPPVENNTTAYVLAVAKAVGVAPTAMIDVDSAAIMRPLVEAIIAHENSGYRYPASVISEGLRLGGIVDAPPPKVASSPEVQGAVLTAATTGGAGLMTLLPAIEGARQQLAPVAGFSKVAVAALVVLGFLGAAIVVWSKVRQARRSGL